MVQAERVVSVLAFRLELEQGFQTFFEETVQRRRERGASEADLRGLAACLEEHRVEMGKLARGVQAAFLRCEGWSEVARERLLEQVARVCTERARQST